MKRRQPTHKLKAANATYASYYLADKERCFQIGHAGHSCFLMYLYLLEKSFLGRSLTVCVSDGQIQRYAGISARTAVRCRPLLRQAGLLHYEDAGKSDCLRMPYSYTLANNPALKDVTPPCHNAKPRRRRGYDNQPGTMAEVIRLPRSGSSLIQEGDGAFETPALPDGSGVSGPSSDGDSEKAMDEYIMREVERSAPWTVK
jgi:hypothetical protein